MDKVQAEIIPKLQPSYGIPLEKCNFSGLCEIRFRANRAVMLYYNNKKCYLAKAGGCTDERNLAVMVSQQDIVKLIHSFCRSSVYAYQEEMKEGFITIDGGHRIGISGRAVTKQKTVKYIDCFSGVNIRIAREFLFCSNECMPYICQGNRIYNSVIISPPGVGKTTILRDIARQLSSKYKVVIVDERSELAACRQGVPQFDVGEQTDVLDAFPKPEGIIHALRSLSPDVIITDEIGTQDDVRAICELLKGGCKIITSMHGYDLDEVINKKRQLIDLFETAILISNKNGVPEVAKCLKRWELS